MLTCIIAVVVALSLLSLTIGHDCELQHDGVSNDDSVEVTTEALDQDDEEGSGGEDEGREQIPEGDSRNPSELDVERGERHGGRGRLPQGQQGQGQGHRLHGAQGCS